MKKPLIILIISLSILTPLSRTAIPKPSEINKTNLGEIKMALPSIYQFAGQPGAIGVINPTAPGALKYTPITYPQSSTTQTSDNTANQTNTGNNYGYNSVSNGGTNYSAYDQAINNLNSALGRLGSQFNSGASGIDASYQNALNQLLASKNQANSAYDTNKHQSALGFVNAKNTIGANAGSSLNGLQRLLGSRGAGGGTAFNVAAPDAVAKEATTQRTGATNTFGQNNQALDTSWNNYLTGYNNQVSGAASQRDQAKQQLQSQIDTNRATLLQTLAQLQAQKATAAGGNPTAASQPYLDQANAVLDKAANYTVAPINYQTQAYTAPDISKYTVNPNAAPTFNGQKQGNDYTSPYLAALLGKKQSSGVAA